MPIFGIGLHHAHQAHDLVAGHQAVGVERQHQRVVAAPARAEVAHVAGLVAGVVGAAPVGDAVAVGIGRLPGLHGLFLGSRGLGVVGIAQHEVAERRTLARRIHARLDGAEARDGAFRILVAQRHEDRSLEAQRHLLVAGGRIGRHLGHGALAEVQQPQPDQRIPEAQHRPRRAEQEAHEQDDIDHRPAAAAQDAGSHPQHGQIGDDIERKHDAPAPGQFGDGLQPGWCRKAHPRRRHGQRRRGVHRIAHEGSCVSLRAR